MAETDATQQTTKLKKTRQKREQRVKVEGKARLELFSEWIDGQLDGIEAAREELGEEAMKAIVAELGKENKSSAVEQDEAIQQYKRASKSNKNRTVSCSFGRRDAVDGRGYYFELSHRHKQI
eukprot:scaffold27981_cov37-Cyclotella_meneghiniana.AAC.5